MLVVTYTVYIAPCNGAPAEISVGSLAVNVPVADIPFGARLQVGGRLGEKKLALAVERVQKDTVCPNVALNVTVVPGGPEVGAKVTVGVTAYAGLGIRIVGTEKSSADTSNNSRYREPTRRVINSKHATHVLVGFGYLMLDV
jgi:hypothetical protein